MASLFAYGRAQLASVYRRREGGRSSRAWPGEEKPNVASAGSLSTVIAHEIIPRLVALGASDADAALRAGDHVRQADRDAFFPLSVTAEADVLLDFVDAMVARGVTAESILLDLLAPAARHLGKLWEEDRCDFVDVTMGLWRLQEVSHELADRVPHGRSEPRGRALFAPLPGDQHSFGAVLLDEIFARGGWDSQRLGLVSRDELLARVAAEPFDLIGLTVTCDCHMGAVSSTIAALRNLSCNSQLRVLVGGRVFGESPGRAIEVGADGTAPDARAALRVANALMSASTLELNSGR